MSQYAIKRMLEKKAVLQVSSKEEVKEAAHLLYPYGFIFSASLVIAHIHWNLPCFLTIFSNGLIGSILDSKEREILTLKDIEKLDKPIKIKQKTHDK